MDAAFTIMATKAFVEGVEKAGRDGCFNSASYLCPNFFGSVSRGLKINEFIRSQSNFFTSVITGTPQNGDLRADQVRYNVIRYSHRDSRMFIKVCHVFPFPSPPPPRQHFNLLPDILGTFLKGCASSLLLKLGNFSTVTQRIDKSIASECIIGMFSWCGRNWCVTGD